MFGTWKYDRETNEVQRLPRAYDPVTARSSQHQACNRCHEKKLKCSGDKAGCDRCTGSGHPCVYSRPGSRSSRKAGAGKAARQPAERDDGRRHHRPHASPPPPSRTTPSSKPGRRIRSPAPAPAAAQTGLPRHQGGATGDAGLAALASHGDDVFGVSGSGALGGYGSAAGAASHHHHHHHLPPWQQQQQQQQQHDVAEPQASWAATAGAPYPHSPYAAAAAAATTPPGLDAAPYLATAGPMYPYAGDDYCLPYGSFDALADDDFPPMDDPRYWGPGSP